MKIRASELKTLLESSVGLPPGRFGEMYPKEYKRLMNTQDLRGDLKKFYRDVNSNFIAVYELQDPDFGGRQEDEWMYDDASKQWINITESTLKEEIGSEMLQFSDEATLLAQKLAKQLADDLKQSTKEDPIKLNQKVSTTIFDALKQLANQYGSVGEKSDEEPQKTSGPTSRRGSWFRS